MTKRVYYIEVPMPADSGWFRVAQTEDYDAVAELIRSLLRASAGHGVEVKVTTQLVEV